MYFSVKKHLIFYRKTGGKEATGQNRIAEFISFMTRS